MEDDNPAAKSEDSAFNVFVRVRPLFGKDQALTSADGIVVDRRMINTIRVQDNMVLSFCFQKK